MLPPGRAPGGGRYCVDFKPPLGSAQVAPSCSRIRRAAAVIRAREGSVAGPGLCARATGGAATRARGAAAEGGASLTWWWGDAGQAMFAALSAFEHRLGLS